MSEQKCVHMLVEGTVQGVGFRYFVQQQAIALNLTGWVRNRLDEKVEILAQGDESSLFKLSAIVRVGPPMANITHVTEEWSIPVVEFKRFSIAPSE